jgi:hypothetical protein
MEKFRQAAFTSPQPSKLYTKAAAKANPPEWPPVTDDGGLKAGLNR